ncbi:MAG: heme lyase CcmF/NrfE family subunit [Actinomycetota bacterium]|nr:heme lyase CcmF/NrfE family subunit [Actinomycetota bacterium]
MPVQVQSQGLTALNMFSLGGIGRPSLLAGLAFALGGVALCVLGAVRGRADWAQAGRRALYATFGFTLVATLALLTALFAHDFSFDYVARYSSRSLAAPYTVSALWGGMEGSLLFWTLLLTGFTTLALRKAPLRDERLVAWAGAVLGGISLFFLMLLIVPANPFSTLPEVPVDGQGLNPLLQSPGMMIHPPLLYTGFVGFSIPFAFAVAALISGRLNDPWFSSTRRWTLFSWSALSIGIVLGGAWAYTELGWGGYWAWDPVENASFLPWLTATAYVHSVVIQEKRRMLKVWNISLILLTYVLAVFGTFLTRSGILSSIHTFTEGATGKWFLPFLAAMLIGGFTIVALRLNALRSENHLDSLLSRESAFLANNVLFLAAAFTVLTGTIYPIIHEAITGIRLSIGPPFFNQVFIPIALAIIALTGIGPLISWRRMSKGTFFRIVKIPLLIGAGVVLALGLFGVRSVGALLAFGLAAFTAAVTVSEFIRGSRVHRKRDNLPWPSALSRTLFRNRRRYGGYVVHLGVVLIVIGFAGAAFSVERQRELQPGQAMEIGDYALTLQDVDQSSTEEKEINTVTVGVSRGGDEIGTLQPQRNFHFAQEQTQSEVAIRTTPVEDLYVVVTALDPDGAVVLRAFVNPLTWWIWMGAGIMALGMSVILSGASPEAATAPAGSRVRRPVVATR